MTKIISVTREFGTLDFCVFDKAKIWMIKFLLLGLLTVGLPVSPGQMIISAAECSERVKTFIVWFNPVQQPHCPLPFDLIKLHQPFLVGWVGWDFSCSIGEKPFLVGLVDQLFQPVSKTRLKRLKKHLRDTHLRRKPEVTWNRGVRASSSREYRVNHGWCYVRKCRIKLCCTKDLA